MQRGRVGGWAGGGRDGASFLEGHAYARDLDLFGPASLFELLNTTRTEIGEVTLADWLRAPAPLGEVRARQTAVEHCANDSEGGVEVEHRRERVELVPSRSDEKFR